MYAIIETGGKQYKVAEGDIITVEKLVAEAGSEYTFDKVLVLAKDSDVKVGAPYVSGAAGGPDGDRRWRRRLPFTRSWVTTGLRRDLRTPLKRHVANRGRT